MKDTKQVTATVCDYGKFILLADGLIEGFDKVNYCQLASQAEFLDLNCYAKGGGIEGIHKVVSFLDPKVVKETDLFIFPDIGYQEEQQYLRSIGKAVWGAMGLNELELSRTKFIDFLDKAGLPKPLTVKIKGLPALRKHLEGVKDKWVKMDRFRSIFETKKHYSFIHSRPWLDALAVRLGGLQEVVSFVVQDDLPDVIEVGYDGWSIDGQFPASSFQGYELKNELYLGSILTYAQLPEQVRTVNEALVPLLKDSGYRNFLATELRVPKDGKPRFIDPTLRMAGLTQDPLPLACKNLPEVIWKGANGELVKPLYKAQYVAVATLHYKGHVPNQWFQLEVNDKAKQWLQFYHYCKQDGLYHFIPSVPFECDEAGVVVGLGDSVKGAIDHLKKNLEPLEGQPVSAETDGFIELVEQIKQAEKQGIKFGNKPLPTPEQIRA